MKAVQRFETKDGELFESESAAREHEQALGYVGEAEALILPKKLDTTDFANGGGYIQITPKTKDAFFKAYRQAVQYCHPSEITRFDQNPTGFIGRVLSDSDSPIYRLYTLAAQIDGAGRLWGQPYFATHPSEGKQVCLAEV